MSKKPWPTKAIMDQIYDQHLWGGNEFDFYSGEGSHDPEIINPYINVTVKFLKSFKTPLTVCDLGCGDFNVGKHIVPYVKKYIAVDIVESLIDRNKSLFKASHLEFYCLDISKDELPYGDCVILRQILQHVSNTEIQNIVEKLAHYKYVILTEHLPMGDFIPNKDILSGQGIRLKHHSGVNILEPPFNFKAEEEKVLDGHILENNKGRIATTLYKVF